MKKIKRNKLFIIGVIVIFISGCVCIIFKNINYKYNSYEYQLEAIGDDFEDLDKEYVVDSIKNEVSNESELQNDVKGNNDKLQIYIHVAGAVKFQGVVMLEEGARIVDAIEKAGGVTEDADISKVNLAYKLSDGQKLYIPSIKDRADEYAVVTNGNGNINNSDVNVVRNEKIKVNINTASQTELETLTGIGPSIAEKIIQYRKENGSFKKIEELKNVSGIGENKFKSIKDEVVVR